MKDWEVRKVNALYADLDKLKQENDQLKSRLFERGARLQEILERLDQLETRVIDAIKPKSRSTTRGKTK